MKKAIKGLSLAMGLASMTSTADVGATDTCTSLARIPGREYSGTSYCRISSAPDRQAQPEAAAAKIFWFYNSVPGHALYNRNGLYHIKKEIPAEYSVTCEIKNGLLGMNRDVNMLLVEFLKGDLDTREIFCVDRIFFKWKDHFSFEQSQRKHVDLIFGAVNSYGENHGERIFMIRYGLLHMPMPLLFYKGTTTMAGDGAEIPGKSLFDILMNNLNRKVTYYASRRRLMTFIFECSFYRELSMKGNSSIALSESFVSHAKKNGYSNELIFPTWLPKWDMTFGLKICITASLGSSPTTESNQNDCIISSSQSSVDQYWVSGESKFGIKFPNLKFSENIESSSFSDMQLSYDLWSFGVLLYDILTSPGHDAPDYLRAEKSNAGDCGEILNLKLNPLGLTAPPYYFLFDAKFDESTKAVESIASCVRAAKESNKPPSVYLLEHCLYWLPLGVWLFPNNYKKSLLFLIFNDKDNNEAHEIWCDYIRDMLYGTFDRLLLENNCDTAAVGRILEATSLGRGRSPISLMLEYTTYYNSRICQLCACTLKYFAWDYGISFSDETAKLVDYGISFSDETEKLGHTSCFYTGRFALGSGGGIGYGAASNSSGAGGSRH